MPLSARLQAIPDWLSAFLVFALFASFGIGLLLIVRRFVHHSVLKPHNDITGFVFATISVIYGVMLAFVVSNVWEQYNEASKITAQESSSAFALYRNLMLYPNTVETDKAIAALQDFTLLIVKKEFPAIQSMRWDFKSVPDKTTQSAAYHLHEAIRRIVPENLHQQSLFNNILQEADSLTELRLQRLLMARRDLLGEIWFMMIMGGLITVGFVSLFGHENIRLHIILASLLSIITGSAVYVAVNLNHPFLGDASIRPDGYEYLITIAKW